MGIRSRTSRFAHILERVGLAMAGALLDVTALISGGVSKVLRK